MYYFETFKKSIYINMPENNIKISITKDLLTFEKQVSDLINDINKDIDDVNPEYISFLFNQLLSFKLMCDRKFNQKMNIVISKKLIKGQIDLLLITKTLKSIQKITKK